MPSAEEFKDFVERREPFILAFNDREYPDNKIRDTNSHRNDKHDDGNNNRGSINENVEHPSEANVAKVKICSSKIQLTGHERWQKQLMGTYDILSYTQKEDCNLPLLVSSHDSPIYGFRYPNSGDYSADKKDNISHKEDANLCAFPIFLFYSAEHQTWNIGNLANVLNSGGGWLVGINSVGQTIAQHAHAVRVQLSATDHPFMEANGTSLLTAQVNCPEDVDEWLVSNGQNWVLDPNVRVKIQSDKKEEVQEAGCGFVPSGIQGFGTEPFCSKRQQQAPTISPAINGSCPPLLKALGWQNVCKWNTEYICLATGHKYVSLAMLSEDTKTYSTAFGGVS